MRQKHQLQGKTDRISFSKIESPIQMPNLIEVQKKSYQWFLDEGLPEVLRDVSPIVDYSGNLTIEFTGYTLDIDHPQYPVEECKERDVNYAAPLKVTVRLANKMTGEVKDTEIFMGDFPLMTDSGTFVINGAERVVVSQFVRSPGVYFGSDIDKTGKTILTSTIIPYRGAWLEYETDANDVFYVKIDKNRKVPITVLIRAFGVSRDHEITDLFGEDPKITATFEKDEVRAKLGGEGDSLREEALMEIYARLRPGEPPLVESGETLLNNTFFDSKRYDLAPVGRYKYDRKLGLGRRIEGHTTSRPVISEATGEVLCDAGVYLDRETARNLEYQGANEAYVTAEDGTEQKVFSNHAVFPEILLGYKPDVVGLSEKVRPDVLREIMEAAGGDRKTVEKLCTERINDLCPKHLLLDDFFASVNYLICLSHGIGSTDDIDHLGNRRMRSVGELLQNQMRIGLSRLDKIVKERMNIQDADDISPSQLINIRPVVTAIREFFGSSPLSQFMDQNNPLAELTHKRRLSALGPGGLSRDRASFDVRDVHYTHYGRMCPIETPEGPNIGLISYLATYAKVSEYGFVQAPFRVVDKKTGVVTDEVRYMTADVEDDYIVAQANEPLDKNNRFVNKRVVVRIKDQIVEVDREEVELMDVSPKMVVSVATAMIPFLENDDNSRALMGSNMQKQAVPLMVTEAPLVATGMEYTAAYDSGVVVIAREAGVVEKVSASEIVVSRSDGQRDVYRLLKFKRSNQGTCINQRPIVSEGEKIEKGQVIADGPATSNGEMSLGKNALVGFMTWEGYNYEDAVLLNERLVRDDVYTSIHIEEYSQESRETKLGPEVITSDIPNVGDDALKDLTPDGVVRIGTEVRAGDILVGKTTPKGETELTAEEKLLKAIFLDKTTDVRDTSLRLPHGESGVVVDTRTFSRENKDELPPGVTKVVRVYIAQKRKISVGDKMAGRHGNKGVVSRILPPEDMPFLADGTPLDIVLNPLGVPSRMNIGQVLEVHLGMAARKLGLKMMTPVFDGANERDILEYLKEAGLWRDILPGENVEGKEVIELLDNPAPDEPAIRTIRREDDPKRYDSLLEAGKLKVIDGKTILYDGRTGEPFDNPVTVGVMYYLKLHHLVDDKIHARSTGPYSLVTQQPLGGKAQFGGQRFGEMEVWALEAYGAAYTLQEILTVKSDDVTGRVKTYEAIVKGENIPQPGVPEAFKVLVKELQSLCLDIRVLDKEGNEVRLAEYDEENHIAPTLVTDDMLGDLVVNDDDWNDSYVEKDEDGEDVEAEFDDDDSDDYDDENGNG